MPANVSKQLGSWMEGRAQQLGLQWVEISERSGLSDEAIRKIRDGRTQRPNRATKAALEAVLQWMPGSIDAILAAGQPTEVPQPVEGADVTPEQAVISLLDLITEARKKLGDKGARAVVEWAFTRPAERDGHQESSSGNNSAAS